MNADRRLAWASVALGLLLLMAASALPWFAVPVGKHAGATVVEALEPLAGRDYRLACGAFVFLAGLVCTLGRRFEAGLGVMAALFFSALLLFPFTVMLADAPISARAGWLQAQHENLTWTGGTLSTSEEVRRADWKSRVVVVDTPRQLRTFRVPTTAEAFGIGRLSDFLEWYGYSNRFCQFVRPGWGAALLGTVCLAAGSWLLESRQRLRNMRRSACAAAGMAVFLLAAAGAPLWIAGSRIAAARESTARGDYEAAIEQLDSARALVPVVGHDTYYLAQLGLLQSRAGHSSEPAARLYAANALERRGLHAESESAYAALAVELPELDPVRREAYRALLRAGIDALNAGENGRALSLLWDLHELDPCSPELQFALQLACLRSRERDALERLTRDLRATYAFFQDKKKRAVLAVCQENLEFAAFLDGDLQAAAGYSFRSSRGTSEPEEPRP